MIIIIYNKPMSDFDWVNEQDFGIDSCVTDATTYASVKSGNVSKFGRLCACIGPISYRDIDCAALK